MPSKGISVGTAAYFVADIPPAIIQQRGLGPRLFYKNVNENFQKWDDVNTDFEMQILVQNCDLSY